MARQRFIWPDIWKDPVFGKLAAAEQVMFIGLFSIADDEGRLVADAAFLRSELYPYKDLANRKVEQIRDSIVEKCRNVHLYRADGIEYIALLKWPEYQKPKYPKPSKLPPPFLEASPILGGSLGESSSKASSLGRVGLGREGLDRAGQESADDNIEEKSREVDRILERTGDGDPYSRELLLSLARRLPFGSVAKVRESVERSERVGVGYAVNALKSEINERGAAA